MRTQSLVKPSLPRASGPPPIPIPEQHPAVLLEQTAGEPDRTPCPDAEASRESDPAGKAPIEIDADATDQRGPSAKWIVYVPELSWVRRQVPGAQTKPALEEVDFGEERSFDTQEQARRWLREPVCVHTNPGPLTSDSDGTRARHPITVTRENRGWRGPVEIHDLLKHEGLKLDHRRLSDFLPAEGFATNKPDLDTRINRVLNEEDPEITCALGPGWDFPAIEKDARQRSDFEGLKIRNPGREIREALCDLGGALEARHVSLDRIPAEALADFWTSWEVHRYLGDFCRRLERYRPRYSGQIKSARWSARVQLARYAHHVRKSAPVGISPKPATDPARKRGPEPKVALHEAVQAAVYDVCGDGCKRAQKKKLTEICGLLDDKQVPFPQAWTNKWQGKPKDWSEASLKPNESKLLKRIDHSLDWCRKRQPPLATVPEI